MSTSVNLMTERARFMTAGTRIGNAWAGIVLAMLVLMVFLCGWTRHRRDEVVQQRESIDASYEPIRQMSAANRAISAQAVELIGRERSTLTLSRRKPFIAVLNVVAEGLAATAGSAHLDALRYGPGAPVPGAASAPPVLTIDVSCIPSYDITQLVEALERPPFIKVKILSSSPGGSGADRKLYILECEF